MTHRDDNSLLDAAQAHADYCDEISSAMRKVEAALAFVFLCLLMWAALTLQVVPV